MATVNREIVTATAHGFAVGNILYWTGSAYAKAKADAAATADIAAIVEQVIDTDNFLISKSGGPSAYIPGLSGLTSNTQYYLSAATAGATTTTRPSSVGQYIVPVYKGVSTTSAMFRPGEPVAIEGFSQSTLGLSANTSVTEAQILANAAIACSNSAAITVTLPAVSGLASGTRLQVVFEANGGGDVVVAPAGSDAINGVAASMTLSGSLKEQGFLIHNDGQADWTFLQG